MQENSNFAAKYGIERKANELGFVYDTFHHLGEFFYIDETGIRNT
jgi:hypothetical protein